MSVTNKSVISSICNTDTAKNANYSISYDQLYWLLFAIIGLLISCSFVALNFLF